MKLISKFKSRYNNITYKTYQTDNGMKVLHLDNPATSNFDFAIIHKAGSAYEDQEGVPRGTAHFLEHMLLNPNDTFKDKDEINRFEQGSINKPKIDINAFTNRRFITFTGYGNDKAKLRILDRLESIYIFNKKILSKYIEREREIILAEKSRKLKKEKDSMLMSLDFLFKGIQDEYTGDVLGEVVNIKKISMDNLEKFFINRISKDSTVLAIQSNGELSSNVITKIEKISNTIPHKKVKPFNSVELKNKWRVGAFSDERANGISITFLYFEKLKKRINYKDHVVRYLLSKLFDWLAFEILREKMGLIYNFNSFRTPAITLGYSTYGYKFTTEKEKIVKVLDEFHKLIYEETFKFLKTNKGKEWFEDIISEYIFPRTSSYDETLGEDTATKTIMDMEIFNYNKAVREAKSVTINDVVLYLKERLKIPPHIWIESDMSKEEMLAIIKDSPFEKEFSSV